MGPANEQQWKASAAGMHFGALLVSFQRFALPPAGVVESAPSSLGALPVARMPEPDCFLLPVADDEAFWIGVIFPAATEMGALVLESFSPEGERTLMATVEPSRNAIIAGIVQPDGKIRTFCRRSVAEFWVRVDRRSARICLTDYESYSLRTGEPAPMALDPSSGFGGWRLP
ncbi:MAG TPA: hypothetical protein VF427_02795 [Noviherbaspirillum sp.]